MFWRKKKILITAPFGIPSATSPSANSLHRSTRSTLDDAAGLSHARIELREDIFLRGQNDPLRAGVKIEGVYAQDDGQKPITPSGTRPQPNAR